MMFCREARMLADAPKHIQDLAAVSLSGVSI